MSKIKVTASIDEGLVRWMDGEVEKKRFATRTHCIEYCLKQIKENK